MGSNVKTLIAASVLLLAGFTGGLVLTGRLSVTTPSGAQPVPPAQATPAVPPPQPTARPAALTSSPAPALPTRSELPSLSAVAEAALKVAANISSTTLEQAPQDPWYQFFYGDRVQQSQSLGSGVIVSPDGYVLTNKHVIGNAGAEIRVTLPDGRERPAKLVGIDDVSDLAVVKVNATNLPTIPWGDSSKLHVADWVLAIGNPFQLSGTVTLGIVSTVSRSGDQVGSYQDFIQTDAAINPGNSGGALIDARGELVGINTMIYSETGGYQGIGFAIPSNLARGIMQELIKNGSVSWGSIGDITFLTVDQQMADRYGLDVTGAFVYSMSRSSSAYRAGLEPGDTVVKVDGHAVANGDAIDRLVVHQKIGSTVTLEVVRRNGRHAELKVPVVARQATTRTR